MAAFHTKGAELSNLAGMGSILFGLAPDFATASLGRLLVGLGAAIMQPLFGWMADLAWDGILI